MIYLSIYLFIYCNSETPIDGQAHTHTHTTNANFPPCRQYQDLINIYFTLSLMDSVTL